MAAALAGSRQLSQQCRQLALQWKDTADGTDGLAWPGLPFPPMSPLSPQSKPPVRVDRWLQCSSSQCSVPYMSCQRDCIRPSPPRFKVTRLNGSSCRRKHAYNQLGQPPRRRARKQHPLSPSLSPPIALYRSSKHANARL